VDGVDISGQSGPSERFLAASTTSTQSAKSTPPTLFCCNPLPDSMLMRHQVKNFTNALTYPARRSK
jgi:hypothetical protein